MVSFAAKGKLAGDEKGVPGGTSLNVLVKNKKVRIDIPQKLLPQKDVGRAFGLFEVEQKKFYAVLEDKKQAFLFDLEKSAPQLEALSKSLPGSSASGGGGTPPSLTKTGKKDRVAGYECELWHIVHEGNKSELCVRTEAAAWLQFPTPALPPQVAWAAELAVVFEGALESGRIELTGIEKKALSASDFEVPRGFVIVSLDQAMLGGLGALAGPGGDPAERLRGLPAFQGLPGLPSLPGRGATGSAAPRAPRPDKK
jgi:hypothetical protein